MGNKSLLNNGKPFKQKPTTLLSGEAPVEHNHNSVYSRKEVCIEKHINIERRIANNEVSVKDINKKINATLIFAVATLIGIVLLFVRGA